MVSGMQTSIGSKVVAVLLVITGILGVVILGTDQILRQTALAHAYVLAVFVIIDLAVAGVVLVKPTKMNFTLSALWSVLRLVLQIADVSQAHMYQMRYREFAAYLFTPTMATPPNPTGIPGAVIDLIMILEIIVTVVAWRARVSASK